MLTILVAVLVAVVALSALAGGARGWAKIFGGLTFGIYWLNAKLFPDWWAANHEKIARRNPGMRLPPPRARRPGT